MGFLWFNSHPAEVFMGDVGSLSLGGALGALAVVTKHELILVVVGGIFVIEALSVMLQFYLNKGLVAVQLVDKFSPAYWAVTAIAIALQAATIALVLRLNAKHFGQAGGHQPVASAG